jgi:UDP-N-acetylmuramoyl-L-alanyl-D-glutamate--2,6-diaminopimelate ligase
VDHAFGRELARRAGGRVWRCAVTDQQDAEFRVLSWTSTREGIAARVQTPRGELVLNSPLFGAHNLENLLVALGSALALGLEPVVVAEALRSAQGAPGRMERVPDAREVLVLVDYAHTPDALERGLCALRPLTRGKLFVVCGCGGDRDRTKRAPMGEVACREADVALLTSDNPRTEDPLAILSDMEVGARKVGARIDEHALRSSRGYAVIADRSQAIAVDISAARAGDTVLIAGKGHEDYQIVGTRKHPFDDRGEAARAIASVGGA